MANSRKNTNVKNNKNIGKKQQPRVTARIDQILDGDKLLITNFKEGAESKINDPTTVPTTIPDTSYSGHRYKKNSSGLKGGYIALIVVLPVVAVAIVAALALLLRKPSANPNVSIPQESTNNMRM